VTSTERHPTTARAPTGAAAMDYVRVEDLILGSSGCGGHPHRARRAQRWTESRLRTGNKAGGARRVLVSDPVSARLCGGPYVRPVAYRRRHPAIPSPRRDDDAGQTGNLVHDVLDDSPA
jgi:hypothetical protein